VRQAVAAEERVRHDEADVAQREVVEQPAVRPVEEHAGRQRAGPLELDLAAEEAEAEPRVDDLVDEEDVAPARGALRPEPQARRVAGRVGLELEDVARVRKRQRPAQILEQTLCG
jgi:hypothetical protein